MLRASVDTLATATHGEVLVGDRETMVTGLAVDSRAVEPSGAFLALPGERVDGHDFLQDALAAGARLLIVTRPAAELSEVIVAAARKGSSVLRADDAVTALQDIASWHRSRLRCSVIGVTGSSGKTTTKDFMTAVLSTTMRTVSTTGNRNNEIGVPLTILEAGSECDALVVEMGMRGSGQIARLCEIARPRFGLVTNVGTTHIELLGSQEAVATAKGELVAAIPEDGAVFLNGDDAFSSRLSPLSKAPVVTYGLSDASDVHARAVVLDDLSRASFVLASRQGDVGVTLPVPGRHNVYNALAAASVALTLAVPLEAIAAGLATAPTSAMRMETFLSASGITVINDAYNANPSSMAAAVDTLAAISSQGQRVAVLGDMAELGSLSELAHFHLGEHVARSGVDVLVTVGERARRIAEGARAQGMDAARVRPCATVGEAVEVLDDVLNAGDTLLVKASRVMGLEAVVEGVVTPRVH